MRPKSSGGDLLVTVSDDGPGMPRGQEEAIFEKFMRGTRESSTPGVGLGLAISRAIIDAHRGRIWAANNPAGGARFSFTLPLGKPPAIPEDLCPLRRIDSSVGTGAACPPRPFGATRAATARAPPLTGPFPAII